MRARRALNEAEEKLRLVKKWALDFDNRVQPLVKELDNLRTMLANELPRAASTLAQWVQALDDYAGVQTHAAVPGEVAPNLPRGEEISPAPASPGEDK